MCVCGKTYETEEDTKINKTLSGRVGQNCPEHEHLLVRGNSIGQQCSSFLKCSLKKMHSEKKYVFRVLCGSYLFHQNICLHVQSHTVMILQSIVKETSGFQMRD